MILTGAQFKRSDVEPLERSYRILNVALKLLRREHFQLWGALIEPYLSDVADSGVVEEWRRRIDALDAENALRAKRKKPKRVALVFTRLQLERHDRAVSWLARYLKGVEVHVVNPHLMSASEEAAGEEANAQIFAYFEQVRVAGRTKAGAASATAWKFGISEDEVWRVIEFRSENRLARCQEPGCDRAPERGLMCMRHYVRERRQSQRAQERAKPGRAS